MQGVFKIASYRYLAGACVYIWVCVINLFAILQSHILLRFYTFQLRFTTFRPTIRQKNISQSYVRLRFASVPWHFSISLPNPLLGPIFGNDFDAQRGATEWSRNAGHWASRGGSITFGHVWYYVWLRLGVAIQFLIPGSNARGHPPPHGAALRRHCSRK